MQLKRGMATWHRSALSSFWKSCISSSDSCSSPSGDTWTKALTSIYINLHPRRSRKQNSSELYTILSNFTLFHYSKCVCKKHLLEKALELMRATILLTKLPEFFGAKDSISIFVLHFHGVLHDNLQNCWISLLSATLPKCWLFFFVCVCRGFQLSTAAYQSLTKGKISRLVTDIDWHGAIVHRQGPEWHRQGR